MLATIKLILQILPLILEIISAVEKQIPTEGKGKEKLQFIKEVLSSTYPQVIEVWSVVEKVIASAVSLYNATGVFKKSSDA